MKIKLDSTEERMILVILILIILLWLINIITKPKYKVGEKIYYKNKAVKIIDRKDDLYCVSIKADTDSKEIYIDKEGSCFMLKWVKEKDIKKEK